LKVYYADLVCKRLQFHLSASFRAQHGDFEEVAFEDYEAAFKPLHPNMAKVSVVTLWLVQFQTLYHLENVLDVMTFLQETAGDVHANSNLTKISLNTQRNIMVYFL